MPIYNLHVIQDNEIEAKTPEEAIEKFVEEIKDSGNIDCVLSDNQYTDQQELKDREKGFIEPEVDHHQT